MPSAKIKKTAETPARRSESDCQRELTVIDQAHIQNETGRDAFIALAHTALFAASVAFVGDLTQTGEARWLPLLIAGWSASVIGLLALTVSFQTAARDINHQRQMIYEPQLPQRRLTRALNGIALWSFPVALVSTFAFASINMLAPLNEGRSTMSPRYEDLEKGIGVPPRGPDPDRRGVSPPPRAPAPPPPAPIPPAKR